MQEKQKVLNMKYFKIKNQLSEIKQGGVMSGTENVSLEHTLKKPNKPLKEITAQDPQIDIRRQFEDKNADVLS
jgi:hypothetical protein